MQGDMDITRIELLEAVPLTELLALAKKFLKEVSSALSLYFLKVYLKNFFCDMTSQNTDFIK